MGAVNCFPSDNAEDEVKEETQVSEGQTSEQPSDVTAGSETAQSWTKLDRAKVDKIWSEIRGDGDKPSDDFIKKAIKQDDFDDSGVLEKKECQRLCESFQLRAKKNGDTFQTWEDVFRFLDKNDDETLDFEDVRYTMTVMWLMTKDRLSLRKVCA